MNNFLINYNNILIPFYDVSTNSGIDNAIRLGFTVNQIIREKKVFEKLINFGDIVYDIGAYVGTHSILFSLLGSKVFAFEPSIFNFSRLEKNTLPFKYIYNFNIAFNDKEYDVLTKFKDCNSNNSYEEDKEQFIKYKIFDKFIEENKIPLPDFMKIDIEGMETILLKTLSQILKSEKTIFYIELHPKDRNNLNISNYKDNPNWLFVDEGGFDFNELKKYNYSFYRSINDSDFIKIDKDLDFNSLNGAIIIIPNNKNIQL